MRALSGHDDEILGVLVEESLQLRGVGGAKWDCAIALHSEEDSGLSYRHEIARVAFADGARVNGSHADVRKAIVYRRSAIIA